MSIGYVNIDPYRFKLGGSDANYLIYKSALIPIIKNKFENLNDDDNVIDIDIYNFNKETNNISSNDLNRLIIIINSTTENVGENYIIEEKFKLNNVEFDYVLSPEGTGTLIKVENKIIAEYHKNNTLNILIDLFGNEYNDKRVAIFESILNEFYKLIIEPTIVDSSWITTNNKKALTDKFVDKIHEAKMNYIDQEKRVIAEIERKTNQLKTQLKEHYDMLNIKKHIIETQATSFNSLDNSLSDEFDKIIKLDKVENLFIEKDKIIVNTKTMYTYTNDGKKYHTGKFRIEINPNNADVHFFGDTPRSSYWTDHDSHPHIAGDTGEACLGNVASTIAELSSQMQLYALVTVCLSFIESVNTADPAGKNIINWDRVDDNGNIIPTKICHNCGAEITESFTAYEYVNAEDGEDDDITYTPMNEVILCENCYDESTYWDNRVDARVLDE